MTSIKDFLDGNANFGWVKATIVSVTRRNPKGYIIDDLNLDDGTGQISLAVFNPTMDFKSGQVINATKCFVKEWNGIKQLSQKKDGDISLVSSGNSLDATIQGANTQIAAVQAKNNKAVVNTENNPPIAVNMDLKPLADSILKLSESTLKVANAIIDSEHSQEKRFTELQVVILRQVRELMGFKKVEGEYEENEADSD